MAEQRRKKLSFRDFVGKLKTEKTLVRLVAFCLVLLVACLVVGIYHINRIYRAYEETSYEYIFDRAQVTSKNFTDDFKRKGNMVQSESEVLSSFATISKENICQGLQSLQNSGEFDYARYISTRGVKFKPDGSLNSVRMGEYSKYIDENADYSVFRNFATENADDEICFASTVSSNGIVQGYVIGVINATSLFGAFDNDTSSTVAEKYLVDNRGDIVIYSKGEELFDGNGQNIYTILTQNSLDDYDAENTKEDIKNQLIANDMMKRQITIGDNSGYVLFKELTGISGWAIFYIVYDHNVQTLIRPVVVESVIAILAIMLVMGVMAGLIMRYLSAEQNRMYELAYTDELTSAPNENAFLERAEALLHDYPDQPYVVCCFDIVNFRYINEGYGHQKADMLLRAIAKALGESYSYNETYARIGADRFVGLAIDDGRLADRKVFITEKIKETTDAIPMKYPIRIKNGIYYVRDRKESVSDMIDKANLARKSLNGDERSLDSEYKDQLMETTKRQEYIESRMEAALDNREFVPYLQPKWDMERNHICGAEALIRWKGKDGKIVPPGDFIPLFEKNGFIEKIDFYMLEEVCRYIRKMIDEGREVYPVSINQSRYLMFDPNYISRVQEIFIKYRVPRGLVELELTETVFFQEKDRMISIMNKLKELNMNLSIDDFGSGFSSLNLLRDIPFDVLKIDRGFLDESSQSASGKWILSKIVEMAEGMDLRVICEGVETQEQVEMLLSIGCKYAQGFLYSRPIPMEEYIEKYNIIKSLESQEAIELAEVCAEEFMHEDHAPYLKDTDVDILEIQPADVEETQLSDVAEIQSADVEETQLSSVAEIQPGEDAENASSEQETVEDVEPENLADESEEMVAEETTDVSEEAEAEETADVSEETEAEDATEVSEEIVEEVASDDSDSEEIVAEEAEAVCEVSDIDEAGEPDIVEAKEEPETAMFEATESETIEPEAAESETIEPEPTEETDSSDMEAEENAPEAAREEKQEQNDFADIIGSVIPTMRIVDILKTCTAGSKAQEETQTEEVLDSQNLTAEVLNAETETTEAETAEALNAEVEVAEAETAEALNEEAENKNVDALEQAVAMPFWLV